MISEDKIKQINRNAFGHAARVRRNHEREMDHSIRFTQPVREYFNSKGRRIDRIDQYDSTAVAGLMNAQAMILSLAVPQGTEWFDIGVKRKFGTRIPLNVRQILRQYNSITTDTLETGNFVMELGNTLFDILGPGTGVMGKVDNPEGPMWFNVPISQIYLLYDEYAGRYHHVFREHEMSAIQIHEMFDDEGDVPTPVVKAINDERYEDKFKVCEAQSYIEDEYHYAVYMKETWEQITYRKLHSPIYYPMIWNKIPNEPWGDGLIRQALPHIQTANQIRKLQVAHAEFNALGAWQAVGDSVVNWRNKKIEPGTILPTGGQELRPLPLPGNYTDLEPALNREEMAIRSIMMMDIIPAPDDGVRTAFEIGKRFQVFVERAGTAALNFETMGLKPMLRGHVKSLQAVGLLPDIQDDNDEIMEFNINSIVKRGRQLEEISRNLEMVNLVTQLSAQMGDPTILMTIKGREFAQHLLMHGGFNPDFIASEEELQAKLDQLAQQEGAQQAMDMGSQLLSLTGQAQDQGLNTSNLQGAVSNAIQAGDNVRRATTGQ